MCSYQSFAHSFSSCPVCRFVCSHVISYLHLQSVRFLFFPYGIPGACFSLFAHRTRRITRNHQRDESFLFLFSLRSRVLSVDLNFLRDFFKIFLIFEFLNFSMFFCIFFVFFLTFSFRPSSYLLIRERESPKSHRQMGKLFISEKILEILHHEIHKHTKIKMRSAREFYMLGFFPLCLSYRESWLAKSSFSDLKRNFFY